MQASEEGKGRGGIKINRTMECSRRKVDDLTSVQTCDHSVAVVGWSRRSSDCRLRPPPELQRHGQSRRPSMPVAVVSVAASSGANAARVDRGSRKEPVLSLVAPRSFDVRVRTAEWMDVRAASALVTAVVASPRRCRNACSPPNAATADTARTRDGVAAFVAARCSYAPTVVRSSGLRMRRQSAPVQPLDRSCALPAGRRVQQWQAMYPKQASAARK
jgi:hypothetical protein